MTVAHLAAILAATILAVVFVLQVLLAAGAPLGHLAWGGRQPRRLEPRFRGASAASAVAVAAAAWVVLARAGVTGDAAESSFVRIATWALAAAFLLNTLGNALSHSRVERRLMTPLTLVLAVCFLVVALS